MLCHFSSMGSFSRHSLIKMLYTALPHGAPFDVESLKPVGVSAKQAARYAKSGWLIRLGQGVYSFPGDQLTMHECIKLLQRRVAGLHVASKTALALQGVRHNLASRERILLWGDVRFVLPEWFVERFPARYSHVHLFDWKDQSLAQKSLTTPPDVTDGLSVSVPERAVLEMLSEVGIHQGLEEARNIFDGLRNPRTSMLGNLLTCCTSVKAVRLFLTWARETEVVDVNQLQMQYRLPVGSDSRWISRFKDGTLLSLKPYG
ncbi:MAG: type IV toxin-antitoxin system AbiEi family antitoxin domain-containing protein [Terrimicrobiaceae bacterium]